MDFAEHESFYWRQPSEKHSTFSVYVCIVGGNDPCSYAVYKFAVGRRDRRKNDVFADKFKEQRMLVVSFLDYSFLISV